MNEPFQDQDKSKLTITPKLFSRLRRPAGALLGILVFILAFLFTSSSTNTWSKLLSISLLSSGLITGLILDNVLRIPHQVFEVLVYSLSSVPIAIIGSLIASSKKADRANGVILLLTYLTMAFFVGILMFGLYGD